MRETISVRGARENNLQNVSVEIPRGSLVVMTGLSGSGKSSLAFDTLYAEGQRRFLESLSAYSRKYVAQLKKPDVDFVHGLSPVISIEQKSVSKNPRSTVGTMTDIYDYLRVLFATSGMAHCPVCGQEVPVRTPAQIAEHLLSLPEGSVVELDAPVRKIYGEDYPYLCGEIRSQGYRRLRLDGALVDLGDDLELDEARDYELEAVVDTVVLKPAISKNLLHSVQNGLRLGEGFLRVRLLTPERRRPPGAQRLVIYGARENNLQGIDVSIPLGLFVCVTGVSGSGKSTLVNEILHKKLRSVFHDSRVLPGAHAAVTGIEHLRDVINIDQSPIGRMPTSNPATYVGVYDSIRQLFAATPESRRRGYTAARFSFNVKGGRCEECAGQGVVTTSLQFMPEVEVRCVTCKGARYNAETLEVTYRGKSIAAVLDLSIEAATAFFAGTPLVAHKLGVLHQLGMGYLKLGQSSTTISGGEAQRVKLAHELSKVKRGGRTLYILDEPTTGLHLADIQRLLDSLRRLVDAGNTVVVIEHHLDVVKTADWVIDLGPEGGAGGGRLVASGPPELIAATPSSWTGRYLQAVLEAREGLYANAG